jgi:hypothetical protein
MSKTIFLAFLIFTFFLGLYVFIALSSKVKPYDKDNLQEFFEGNKSDCPDLLVRKDGVILLYNTSKPVIDGHNPLPFYSLDEYIVHLERERTKGNNCPVLYLQAENNTQGDTVYRARPSPFDMQGGLQTQVPEVLYKENAQKMLVPVMDASRANAPYNVNQYAGFDAHGQHIGETTTLDELHASTTKHPSSDNAMDENWGGVKYTQNAVKVGKYKDREVTKPRHSNHPGAY